MPQIEILGFVQPSLKLSLHHCDLVLTRVPVVINQGYCQQPLQKKTLSSTFPRGATVPCVLKKHPGLLSCISPKSCIRSRDSGSLNAEPNSSLQGRTGGLGSSPGIVPSTHPLGLGFFLPSLPLSLMGSSSVPKLSGFPPFHSCAFSSSRFFHSAFSQHLWPYFSEIMDKNGKKKRFPLIQRCYHKTKTQTKPNFLLLLPLKISPRKLCKEQGEHPSPLGLESTHGGLI